MGRNRSRSRSMSSSSSGRGAQSSSWDGQQGYRIHVSDLAAGVSRKEIERAFGKYGTVNEVWVATNPPCFAFVNFKHRSDAEKAIRDVDGKLVGSTRVGVSWARTRTFGGRSRGGRGAPFGSYRSSNGGRRSRSRSRSGSRQQRRRPSRSRSGSRDRRRQRSDSPRDRKRSRRSSQEKNGTSERKDDRTKENSRKRSKTPRSASRSRSHTKERSMPRRGSADPASRRSQSRASSAGDRRDNETTGSPTGAGVASKRAFDPSPVAATAD